MLKSLFVAMILLPFQAFAEEGRLPADLLQISGTEAFSKYVLLVDKSARKLIVYERNSESIQKIDEVPTDIGKSNGNKTKENDHKTPEGIYFFQTKLTQPEIPYETYGKMAFTTDYPNLFDQRMNKTGSGIWMHSIPDQIPLTRGSRGCVVIRNNVLEKIANYIKLRETPIIIYDQIDYVSKEEHNKRRYEMGQWLDSWRSAWESMDINKYLAYYDKNFSAPGFKNYRAWEKHKTKLKNRYKYMKITLSQPFLLLHRDQLIVKTLQKYESNEHTDYGIKTVHAMKTTEGYKIIRESWTSADEKGNLLESARQLTSESQRTELPY